MFGCANISSVSGNFCPDFGIVLPRHVLHPGSRSLALPGKASERTAKPVSQCRFISVSAFFVIPSAVEKSLIFLAEKWQADVSVRARLAYLLDMTK